MSGQVVELETGADLTLRTRFQRQVMRGPTRVTTIADPVSEIINFASQPYAPMGRVPFEQSVFSRNIDPKGNDAKVVGGSDDAVSSRYINGARISSAQELSTMCFLGKDHKGQDSIIVVFVSNAFRLNFDKLAEKTGCIIDHDNGRATDEAKQGAGKFLGAEHGFFNPHVVLKYYESTLENSDLPPLSVFFDYGLLETPTTTRKIVTNAGSNLVNWELDPQELLNAFAYGHRDVGWRMSVVQEITTKRDDCWQVDLSKIGLIGGNPDTVLEDLKRSVSEQQRALLRTYAPGYHGDAWKSKADLKSTDQAVLSMDLESRWPSLWEEYKDVIDNLVQGGAQTIAFADGASNYFVPMAREYLAKQNLDSHVQIISYPEVLQIHLQESDVSEAYLMATPDGMELGEFSIFSDVAQSGDIQLHVPEDTIKEVPVMVEVAVEIKKGPNKGQVQMKNRPDPSGAKEQRVDNRNTKAIKYQRIEDLLRSIKDNDGQIDPETHIPLLKEAISWVPDGATLVLGATELEKFYRDSPEAREVFEAKELNIVCPLYDLVPQAVAARATSIIQPPVGKYRAEDVPDYPETGAPDHVERVRFAMKLDKSGYNGGDLRLSSGVSITQRAIM